MNLNSELRKEENFACGPLRHGVEGSLGAMGCRPYGEKPADYTTYISHLLSK
jgi:hypothetical protein